MFGYQGFDLSWSSSVCPRVSSCFQRCRPEMGILDHKGLAWTVCSYLRLNDPSLHTQESLFMSHQSPKRRGPISVVLHCGYRIQCWK